MEKGRNKQKEKLRDFNVVRHSRPPPSTRDFRAHSNIVKGKLRILCKSFKYYNTSLYVCQIKHPSWEIGNV